MPSQMQRAYGQDNGHTARPKGRGGIGNATFTSRFQISLYKSPFNVTTIIKNKNYKRILNFFVIYFIFLLF